MSFSEKGFKLEAFQMGQKVIKGYVEGTLGKKRERKKEEGNEVPFAERNKEEQTELFYQLESLVAERRDLTQTTKGEGGKNEATKEEKPEKADKKKEEGNVWEIRVLNGRRILVPRAGAEAAPETHAKDAEDTAATRLKEIVGELTKLNTIPGLKEAYEQKLTKFYFMMKAARKVERLKSRVSEIDFAVADIRSRSTAQRGGKGAVRGKDRVQVELLLKERQESAKTIEEMDAYEGGHELRRFLQIKEYAETFSKERMVEFPSAKSVIDEGLDNMRRHQPFLLAGHLGTGKTEYARHMAKVFMIENGVGYDPSTLETKEDIDALYDKLEPEFFSGGEEASVYDLIGKLKLVGKSAEDPRLLAARVQDLTNALAEMRVTAVPQEELAKIILGKGDVTETVFHYGPLGRALRDGKPIIIDEVNLIPAAVLGRINTILLRGVGSRERLQENGEESFPIKPGFAVIGTCNLGRQYAGIQEVNAAFKSRWIAKEVSYPELEETYDLILAALVRKDRVRLPPNFPAEDFDRLASLAVVTREIQEIFAGRTDGQRFMALANGPAAERGQLEKAVVSTRDLMRKIIQPWKEKDFSVSLDEIIGRNILAAEVFSKDDQRFMTELFLRRGFFKGWDAKKFEKMGISGVTQAEINALHVNIGKFNDVDVRFGTLLKEAAGRASLIKAELLVGTKKKSA